MTLSALRSILERDGVTRADRMGRADNAVLDGDAGDRHADDSSMSREPLATPPRPPLASDQSTPVPVELQPIRAAVAWVRPETVPVAGVGDSWGFGVRGHARVSAEVRRRAGAGTLVGCCSLQRLLDHPRRSRLGPAARDPRTTLTLPARKLVLRDSVEGRSKVGRVSELGRVCEAGCRLSGSEWEWRSRRC